MQDFAGVASGSFVAPDHEYPSYLELRLTATDSGGLTDTKSVRLDPKTVELSFRSDPAGLQLTVGSAEPNDALLPHGYRRLEELHKRPLAADAGGDDLQVRLLV